MLRTLNKFHVQAAARFEIGSGPFEMLHTFESLVALVQAGCMLSLPMQRRIDP